MHCVAGAHRAGTAGCLLLMHYHQLAAKVRVDTVMSMPPPMRHGALTCLTCTCHARAQEATVCMRNLRPVTEPKGSLLQLFVHYEQAVGVVYRVWV